MINLINAELLQTTNIPVGLYFTTPHKRHDDFIPIAC